MAIATGTHQPSPSETRRLFSQPIVGVGTLNLSGRAKKLVLGALEANRLSAGPLMQRFEHDFAELHGCEFGVMSNSGTSSLLVSLQALKELHGWHDGDEVLVPAVTFVATANVVLQNGMVPVLVDVDPLYYEMDPTLIEAKITPRTRAVLPVHLFGHPADMDPIRGIAERHSLKIVEDSCETMFASYNGRSVGSLGDIGCFSTYVAHLLVTGTGGLSITNDRELAIRLRSLINHGRDSIYISIDDDDDKSGEELRLIVGRRFKFTSIGHSFRATELEAAIGVAQLEHWEPMIAARRANARALAAKLRAWEAYLQLPGTRPGSQHSFMMFPIVLRSETKDQLVQFLEEHGVETRDMLPLTNQPVYHRLLGWREADYPVAKWVNDNGFYIGCHQELSDSDLDYMAELFERFFRRRPTRVREGACLFITSFGESEVVERLFEELPGDLFERMVASGPVTDERTVQVCRRYGVEIVDLRGKAPLHAVADGSVAVEQDGVVFWAADGRYNPRDVGRLLLALERGNDMVIASRFLHGASRDDQDHQVRYRSAGNRVFTLLANVIFYGNFSDTLQSLRAVRRRRLADVALQGPDLLSSYQLSIQAMKKGWRIAEIPAVEVVDSRLQRRSRILSSVPRLAAVLMREWWAGKQSAKPA